MIEKIRHIAPREITDIVQLQELAVLLINIVESQAKQIDDLVLEVQDLRNEVNRLKGEHGDLPPKPPKGNSPKNMGEGTRKKTGRKNNKTGPKNPKIEIDNVVICDIDKDVLPPDAKFQYNRKVIQQDIIIRRNNTQFEIPVYYSRKEKRTYSGELPSNYDGEFGGQLKSWIQMLHYYCDVTQGRTKKLMDNLGILISEGTISNILLSNTEVMAEEAREILRAGIETVPFAQMDGTKSWESGKGKSTQIISTPSYSIYHTMESKSRVDILWALQGKPGNSAPLAYNSLAIKMLCESDVAKKDQRLLGQLLSPDQNYTLKQLESLLKRDAAHLLKKASYPKITGILALAYYLTQTDFPRVNILLSDAGPEYTGIAAYNSLCWLHEERHYKKMIPKLDVNRAAISKVRGQIWELYKKLLIFKKLPPDQQALQKQGLRQEFDAIFTKKTDYQDLNDRIEKTFAKKQKLLLVLDFPFLPLHNNDAELAVRRKVRKRDISLHTMSLKGTMAQDAFMSVVETAAKLGVNALDYLYDRITKQCKMPSLASLVRVNTL